MRHLCLFVLSALVDAYARAHSGVMLLRLADVLVMSSPEFNADTCSVFKFSLISCDNTVRL